MAELLIDDLDNVQGIGAMAPLPQLHSRELSLVESGTDRISLKALGALDLPHPADRFKAEVTEVPAVAGKAAAAAVQAGISGPHPALEGLKATLLYERHALTLLRGNEEETTKHLQAIDQLLDLSAELGTLSDRDKYDLSEKMQSILKDLKETKGIDLLKGDPKTITKDQLAELKSAIGGRVDSSRTKVQQIFTKMQTTIQHMMSVNDSGKRLISEFVQFMRTVTKNMRP